MSITVTSTTDSAEAVAAAQGGSPAPAEVKVEDQPAAGEAPAETLEASEAPDETENNSEDDGEEKEGEGEDRPKKKGGLRKRIGKLTKQREEARKEADYWRNEALKDRGLPPKPQEAAAEPAAKPDGKPLAENFDTHEAFVEALADWKVEQRLSKEKEQSKLESVKTEQATKLKTFLDKREEFAKAHDDFFEAMEDIQAIPMSITVNETLLDSEHGPELLYELAKDPEEYKRICALPAIQAARELGKIEAKLQKSPEPKKLEAKTTKAPKPIAPVGSGSASSTKPIWELDFQEYKKAREAGRT